MASAGSVPFNLPPRVLDYWMDTLSVLFVYGYVKYIAFSHEFSLEERVVLLGEA